MLLTIIAFIIILGVLIFVHELGHFVMAKKNGVRVDEFGFGFPPRILGIQRIKTAARQKVSEEKEELDIVVDSFNDKTGQEIIRETIISKSREIDVTAPVKKWCLIWGKGKPAKNEMVNESGTIYSINAIPLGGFVKIYGEEGEGEGDRDSFVSKKAWQKAMILVAGVAMNFILACLLFGLGNFIGQPTSLSDEEALNFPGARVAIIDINEDSPAALAGFQSGDQIVGFINSQGQKIEPIKNVSQFQQLIEEEKGQKITLIFERGKFVSQTEVVPRVNPPAGQGSLGIQLSNIAIVRYPWYRALYQGFLDAAKMAWMIMVVLYQIVKSLILHGRAGADVGGPVYIYKITGQFVQLGFIYLVRLTALLSINLAIINILPIPALDGGRILFLILEKIKGGPISQKTQNIVHSVSFALLILLMLFVTYHDILRLTK